MVVVVVFTTTTTTTTSSVMNKQLCHQSQNKNLNHDISILKGSVDRFVRKSYFGGHTDIYKNYIKKGKYYDINSLYPFAMLKPMPNQLRQIYKNMNNINLNDFFGFIKCEITTPNNILKPILPYKDVNSNRTIYPIGN
jgi:hypothetical protein